MKREGYLFLCTLKGWFDTMKNSLFAQSLIFCKQNAMALIGSAMVIIPLLISFFAPRGTFLSTNQSHFITWLVIRFISHLIYIFYLESRIQTTNISGLTKYILQYLIRELPALSAVIIMSSTHLADPAYLRTIIALSIMTIGLFLSDLSSHKT